MIDPELAYYLDDPSRIDAVLTEMDQLWGTFNGRGLLPQSAAYRQLLRVLWRYPEPMDALFLHRPFTIEELLSEVEWHGIPAEEQRLHHWAAMWVVCTESEGEEPDFETYSVLADAMDLLKQGDSAT